MTTTSVKERKISFASEDEEKLKFLAAGVLTDDECDNHYEDAVDVVMMPVCLFDSNNNNYRKFQYLTNTLLLQCLKLS